MKKHYFDMEVNSINRDWIKKIEWEKGKTLFKNSESIPEWDSIKIFQWVFSQNFTNWEKSRNWYKYDQNGWFVDNYKLLPIILWQHDDSYGWIWFTQELYLDTNWNLAWIFYVDLDTLEDRHANQVKKWFVKWISTWAKTIESMYEHNDTWKRYTRADAEEEFGWENVWKSMWGATDAILTYVITKAELIENSMVTIWSNFWAIAKTVNSINDEMETIANQIKSKYDKNNLFSKNSTMNLEEALLEVDALKISRDGFEKKANENDTKITELNDSIVKKDEEIKKLTDKVSENEIKINDLTSSDKVQKDRIDELEKEAKDLIMANANINNEGWEEWKGKKTDNVKTIWDFTKKHGA